MNPLSHSDDAAGTVGVGAADRIRVARGLLCLACMCLMAAGCSPKKPGPVVSAPVRNPTPEPSRPAEPRAKSVADRRPKAGDRPDRKDGTVYPGWGKLRDPQNDTAIYQEDSKLMMIVPPGLHDINPSLGGMKAPRILQEVEGNFTLEVTVGGEFAPGEQSAGNGVSSFYWAGISVWVDDTTYLRLERNAWWDVRSSGYLCYAPLYEVFNKSQPTPTKPDITSSNFFGTTPTRFRLVRNSQYVKCSYSTDDGNTWRIVPQLASNLPPKLQVGVGAVSTSARPFTVVFEDFKLTHD